MSVEIYIAALLTVVVLAILVMTTALVVTLIQVKRAAQALAFLAGRAEDRMVQLGDAVGALSHVALGFVGGVGRKAALGAGLLYSFFSFLRRHRRAGKRADQPQETGGSDE
jgi:hypothetical protein